MAQTCSVPDESNEFATFAKNAQTSKRAGTLVNNAVWRFALWLVFIPVGTVLGYFVGRWLAPIPDQVYLFRSFGSVVGACLAAWILLKITGPPGPDRPAGMRNS
jgi:hypothetical protein